MPYVGPRRAPGTTCCIHTHTHALAVIILAHLHKFPFLQHRRQPTSWTLAQCVMVVAVMVMVVSACALVFSITVCLVCWGAHCYRLMAAVVVVVVGGMVEVIMVLKAFWRLPAYAGACALPWPALEHTAATRSCDMVSHLNGRCNVRVCVRSSSSSSDWRWRQVHQWQNLPQWWHGSVCRRGQGHTRTSG